MSRPTTNKRMISYGMNQKIITGLTEGDLLKHTYDLTDVLPSNAVILYLQWKRQTGAGALSIYPNEGTQGIVSSDNLSTSTPVDILNNRIQYSLSIIDATYDVWCIGVLRELSMMQSDIR